MNCKLVAEKGGTPYIKPKKNTLMKAAGPWKNMVTLFKDIHASSTASTCCVNDVEAGWQA
jgi:hypothetical protein